MSKLFKASSLLPVAVMLCACAPEVGSEKWCEDIADTPKGDWSTNDAKAFAKHCVFNTYKDEDDQAAILQGGQESGLT